MERVRALAVVYVLAACGCDGVFGLNTVPNPTGDAAPPAGLSFVQDVSTKVQLGGLTATVPFSQPPAAHDLIVVAIAAYHNTPTLVSDTAGNAYSELSAEGMTAGGSSLFIYYAADVKKVEQFTITVASMEGSDIDDELSVDALEYHGAQASSPLDRMQSHSGAGSTSQVDEDCLPLQVTGAEIMVAALTRDFNGSTIPAPGWITRGSIDLDHTMYAVLTTADRIAADEIAHPEFSSEHNADGYTWACLWATFR